MFTALDHTLAYQRREEMARQVSLARLDNRSRPARQRRWSRWSLRFARMLRTPSNANVARAGNA